jgi:predicted KAP-like P-loop ATPase
MTFHEYQIILDIPAENPGLGFESYAEAYKGIIQGSDPRFSIGIFGGWGSGKSTLMDEIRSRLEVDACIAVPFSAWRYEKEEHLIVPLLDSIRGAVNDWSKKRAGAIAEVATKVARTIGGVTESILRGFSVKAGVPNVLEASFDANKAITAAAELDDEAAKAAAPRSFYFASFESLKSCFTEFHEKSGGARIVVFIDDLDRCLPEGALEVLESMKLFFDFDGFVFVVGLDQQVVEWCIDRR